MPLAVKQGLRFNGLTDYVQTGTLPMFGAQAKTTEAWVYGDASGSIIMHGVASVTNMWNLLVNGQGVPVLDRGGGGAQGSTSLTKGVWNHISVTYDGSTMTMYLNGVSQASVVIGLNITFSTMKIGDGYSGKFNGKIASVRAYDRALSAAEVTANYNGQVTRTGLVGEWLFQEGQGTTAYDTSGNGNNGAINGATYLIKKAPQKAKKNMLKGSASDWSAYNGANTLAYPVDRYTFLSNTTAGYQQIVPAIAGNTYTLSGYIKGRTYLQFLDANNNQTGLSTIISNPSYQSFSISLLAPANTTQALVKIDGSGMGDSNREFNVYQLEQGSTATAYEPFVSINDNKPSAKKPKKNYVPTDVSAWEQGVFNSTDGTPTPTALRIRTANFQKAIPNTQYTHSCASGYSAIVYEYDSAGIKTSTTGGYNSTLTFTTNSQTAQIKVGVRKNDDSAIVPSEIVNAQAQLEQGSVASSFEQYILLNDVKPSAKKPKKNMFTSQYPVGYSSFNAPYDYVTLALKPNTTYIYSADINGTSILYVSNNNGVDKYQTFINVGGRQSLTFTTGSNGSTNVYVLKNGSSAAGITADTLPQNMQLEQGSAATAFESFQLINDVKAPLQ